MAASHSAPPQPIVQKGGSHFKVGIIGYPNVGKSCLFNTLAENRRGKSNRKKAAAVGNFLFTTVDPNMVTLMLPDDRLQCLRGLFGDGRGEDEIAAALGGGTRVTLVDTRGVVKGDYTEALTGNSGHSYSSSSDGECLAPVDVLLHLLRGFEGGEITHMEETVDPLRDYHTTHKEIMAKDLLCIERILNALRPAVEVQTGGTDAAFEFQTLERAWEALTGEAARGTLDPIPAPPTRRADATHGSTVYDRCNGTDIYLSKWSVAEKDVLARYQFLTAKASVIVLNVSRWDYLRGEGRNIWHARVQELADRQRCGLLTLSLDFECTRTSELAACRLREDGAGEVERLLSANPTHLSAAVPLLYECLQSLRLLQVYTALPSREETLRFLASGIASPEGEKLQVSTWMVPDGAGGSLEDLCNLSHGVTASRAMKRADVIAYDHLLEYQGDVFKARLDGQVHSHNKSYLLVEGDVVMALGTG